MNRTLILISCVAMLTLSGCFRILIPVSTTWPQVKYPQRPHVELPDNANTDTEKQLVKAAFQYSRHIDVLEKTIDTYNKEATEHNEKVEHELFGD